MTTEVTLVKGYIPKVDQTPDTLSIPSPHLRLAIVTHSYQLGSSEDTQQIDSKLLVDVIKVICGSCEFEVESAASTRLSPVLKNPTWELVENLIQNWQFRSLIALSNQMPWIHIIEVPYFKVGGPAPYHDSATLEVFVPLNDYDKVWQSVVAHFSSLPLKTAIIQGTTNPESPKFWRRLFRV